MLLQKTDKGRHEVRSRERTLPLRERSLLLLADGQKSLADFVPMFDGQGEQIVIRLVKDGYLEPVRAAGRAGLQRAAAAPVEPPAVVPAPEPAAGPAVAADPFEGKRSLATTRMFLFDICERMFARRSPAQAERFREALRAARDRASMLAASREMLTEIEAIAGPERADSISERIAMLLPPEDGAG